MKENLDWCGVSEHQFMKKPLRDTRTITPQSPQEIAVSSHALERFEQRAGRVYPNYPAWRAVGVMREAVMVGRRSDMDKELFARLSQNSLFSSHNNGRPVCAFWNEKTNLCVLCAVDRKQDDRFIILTCFFLADENTKETDWDKIAQMRAAELIDGKPY